MPDANAKKARALRALLLCKSVEEAAKISGVSKPWFFARFKLWHMESTDESGN